MPVAGPVAQSWIDRLGDSSLGVAMRSDLWLYPLVEVVHIVGFSVLVGAVVMFCASSGCPGTSP
jgi:hypothetical protein